jgi:hypothetical protein
MRPLTFSTAAGSEQVPVRVLVPPYPQLLCKGVLVALIQATKKPPLQVVLSWLGDSG